MINKKNIPLFYIIYKFSIVARKMVDDDFIDELYNLNKQIDKEIKKNISKKKYSGYKKLLNNIKVSSLYNTDYFILFYLEKNKLLNKKQEELFNNYKNILKNNFLPKQYEESITLKYDNKNRRFKTIYKDGLTEEKYKKYLDDYNNKVKQLEKKIVDDIIKPTIKERLGIKNKKLEDKWIELIVNNYYKLWI